MAGIELILFDVGGVLGTNGWDTGERAAAVRTFNLDGADFERRHREAKPRWESGETTIDEYLGFTVFYAERPFTPSAFRDFMRAQSVANEPMLALARALAASGSYRLMTFNNESAELHRYRVERFGLDAIFVAFLVSCFLGGLKPEPVVYERALGIAGAVPDRTVFIDDRAPNLEPARARGVHTIHATNVEAVREGLTALGVAVPEQPAGAPSAAPSPSPESS